MGCQQPVQGLEVTRSATQLPLDPLVGGVPRGSADLNTTWCQRLEKTMEKIQSAGDRQSWTYFSYFWYIAVGDVFQQSQRDLDLFFGNLHLLLCCLIV